MPASGAAAGVSERGHGGRHDAADAGPGEAEPGGGGDAGRRSTRRWGPGRRPQRPGGRRAGPQRRRAEDAGGSAAWLSHLGLMRGCVGAV